MTFKGRGRRRLLGAGLGSLAGSALAGLAGCAKPPEKGNPWTSALHLDASRQRVSGSEEALAAAIRRGADLRIRTEFKNNEHIDTSSESAELIEEVAEFAGTYLMEDRWVAGIMTLRQPISLPDGFGSRPSMSFFLYNQDGRQAIARPYLDGEKSRPNRVRRSWLTTAACPSTTRWTVGTRGPMHPAATSSTISISSSTW